MATCKEVSELVSQRLDRRLGLRDRLRVRLHLWVCDACARFAQQIEWLRRAARTAGALEPRLSPEARTRIRSKLGLRR
jgi:predicted anti-sigma-YlaC factor YlaD